MVTLHILHIGRWLESTLDNDWSPHWTMSRVHIFRKDFPFFNFSIFFCSRQLEHSSFNMHVSCALNIKSIISVRSYRSYSRTTHSCTRIAKCINSIFSINVSVLLWKSGFYYFDYKIYLFSRSNKNLFYYFESSNRE